MRRFAHILVVTACSAVWALPAAAQYQPAGAPVPRPASTGAVALVDIVKVFENHPRFRQQMDAIRDEIQSFERELGQSKENIDRKNQQLTSAASEVERRQIEADLTRQVTDVQLKAQRKKSDILERESQIYYQTYNEVVTEVRRLADAYGINLVLRYDSAEMVAHDRDSVLKGVTRPIVIQRNLDLTGEVIRRLGGSVSQSPPRGEARPNDISKRIPFSGGYSN
ncbi:MAG: OmpH family outer membrane protein [Pirellulaceae bacterium]